MHLIFTDVDFSLTHKDIPLPVISDNKKKPLQPALHGIVNISLSVFPPLNIFLNESLNENSTSNMIVNHALN